RAGERRRPGVRAEPEGLPGALRRGVRRGGRRRGGEARALLLRLSAGTAARVAARGGRAAVGEGRGGTAYRNRRGRAGALTDVRRARRAAISPPGRFASAARPVTGRVTGGPPVRSPGRRRSGRPPRPPEPCP